MESWLLLLILIVLVWVSLKIVKPQEAGLVFRGGKFYRTAAPGMRFIVPFLERMVKLDLSRDLDALMRQIFQTWPLPEETSAHPEVRRLADVIRSLKEEYDRFPRR